MAKTKKASIKKYPQIYFDKENDFTSIRLTSGIEKKSYTKSGFVFLESSRGKIIEIQILNKKK